MRKATAKTFDKSNFNSYELEHADKRELVKIIFQLALSLQRLEGNFFVAKKLDEIVK